MSTSQDDDRWLDVLAGRAEPSNDDERKAARARQFFQKEAEQDLQVDAATRQRIENLVRAKLEAAKQLQKPEAHAGWWAAVTAWFFPEGSASAGRFATAAMAVMALVAVPTMINPGAVDPEDPTSIKSPITVPETVIAAEQPAQDATKLLQALANQGVVAALTEEGADRVVVAHIPADKLNSVASTLQQELGVVLPPDGELRVRFKASAP